MAVRSTRVVPGALEAVEADDEDSTLIPAAAYVRMSTEHQRYSADNQLEVIRRYADERGYAISVIFSDLGKSGVRLAGRPGLQQLLSDVETGTVSFKALLVYDVSRWGRFQDPDEAATYELKCKRAGVPVHYCAEPFENDGSISSSLVKAIKRAMAGEYSRELSVKVHHGQANLARRGFHMNGPEPFGLRRLLVGEGGEPKGYLAPGERKAITTDRVVLAAGLPAEIKVVRRVFRMYLDEVLPFTQIAGRLNDEGVAAGRHPKWTVKLVRTILRNEKYSGRGAWGKTSLGLDSKRVPHAPENWIWHPLHFPPIIPPKRFEQAQIALVRRRVSLSSEAMLQALKALAAREGYLDRKLIDAANLGFTSDILQTRFGGQLEAYALIGYTPRAQYPGRDQSRELRLRQAALRDEVITTVTAMGFTCALERGARRIRISDQVLVHTDLVRPLEIRPGIYRWKFRRASHADADIFVIGRLSPDSFEAKDYYILPRDSLHKIEMTLDDINAPQLARFRSPSIQSIMWLLVQWPSLMKPFE